MVLAIKPLVASSEDPTEKPVRLEHLFEPAWVSDDRQGQLANIIRRRPAFRGCWELRSEVAGWRAALERLLVLSRLRSHFGAAAVACLHDCVPPRLSVASPGWISRKRCGFSRPRRSRVVGERRYATRRLRSPCKDNDLGFHPAAGAMAHFEEVMLAATQHGLRSTGALTSFLRDYDEGRLSQRIRSGARVRGAHAHPDLTLVEDFRSALQSLSSESQDAECARRWADRASWRPEMLQDDRSLRRWNGCAARRGRPGWLGARAHRAATAAALV